MASCTHEGMTGLFVRRTYDNESSAPIGLQRRRKQKSNSESVETNQATFQVFRRR